MGAVSSKSVNIDGFQKEEEKVPFISQIDSIFGLIILLPAKENPGVKVKVKAHPGFSFVGRAMAIMMAFKRNMVGDLRSDC